MTQFLISGCIQYVKKWVVRNISEEVNFRKILLIKGKKFYNIHLKIFELNQLELYIVWLLELNFVYVEYKLVYMKQEIILRLNQSIFFSMTTLLQDISSS